jgi:peptide chain release factor 1
MKVLKTRLLEIEQAKQNQAISSARQQQVGSGARSEKVRTYNFPQDRMTDHRVPGLTVHNLPGLLDGEIDQVIDSVATWFEADQLGGDPEP